MPRWRRVLEPWLDWDEPALRRGQGIYLHVPYCLARCNYCAFLSFGPPRPGVPAVAAYVALLLREIQARGAWAREAYGAAERVADTVFIGGGTPTTLPAAALCEVVLAVREHFAVPDHAEISVEANPDTLDAAYLEALAQAGVNRISVGVQAVDDRHLSFLGRTYRWERIAPVLESISRGPVARFSFDLLYGVPGLTPRGLRVALERLLDLGPRHLSAYELTADPATCYTRWSKAFPGALSGERVVLAQQRQVECAATARGLYRYEVSSYAWPGQECRHNLRYWRGGDYLGLGLGAASRTGTVVVNNPSDFTSYQAAVEAAGSERDGIVLAYAAETARRPEYAALAPPADGFLRVRTRLGLTGEPPWTWTPGLRREVARWFARGWITPRVGGFAVTSRGLNHADAMARALP